MPQMSPFLLCAAIIGYAVLTSGSQAHAGEAFDQALRGSQVPINEDNDPPPRYVPGSPVYYRWQGIYAGALFGRTGSGVDFGQGTSSLIDYILRNDVVGRHVAGWTTLPKKDTTASTYGGFIGFNYQSDELVLSGEVNYSRPASNGLHSAAADSMTRLFQDDAQAPAQHHFFYTASVGSQASATLTDFATVRGRAGVVFNRFLPYAFAGVALGRVDIFRSATVSYRRQDIPDNVTPPTPPITPLQTFNFGPQTQSENRKGVIAYGYTAGLGLDVALTPNLFMRAEWEYVQFFPVQDFKIHLNTMRVGVGIKF